jgi:hypothetical protein
MNSLLYFVIPDSGDLYSQISFSLLWHEIINSLRSHRFDFGFFFSVVECLKLELLAMAATPHCACVDIFRRPYISFDLIGRENGSGIVAACVSVIAATSIAAGGGAIIFRVENSFDQILRNSRISRSSEFEFEFEFSLLKVRLYRSWKSHVPGPYMRPAEMTQRCTIRQIRDRKR